MHRGWGIVPKRRHRTYLGAWWHLHQHRKKDKWSADRIWIYPCWFTDGNSYGRRHFHIGHMPRKVLRAGKPRPGTLMIGVFSVQDGFEARTFQVRPPLCYPAMPTVGEALAACREFA